MKKSTQSKIDRSLLELFGITSAQLKEIEQSKIDHINKNKKLVKDKTTPSKKSKGQR